MNLHSLSQSYTYYRCILEIMSMGKKENEWKHSVGSNAVLYECLNLYFKKLEILVKYIFADII